LEFVLFLSLGLLEITGLTHQIGQRRPLCWARSSRTIQWGQRGQQTASVHCNGNNRQHTFTANIQTTTSSICKQHLQLLALQQEQTTWLHANNIVINIKLWTSAADSQW